MNTTDSYLSFFLSYPLKEVWNLFLIGLARIIPIIALAPFLGGKILSNPMKIGFGIALTALFLPYLLVHAAPPAQIDLLFMLLLVKEIIVGMFIGLLISMPFYFSQAAGTLIDHQRGAQSLQVTDPSSQVQASPTGILYNNMMLFTYFAIGAPILFFQGVFVSYQLLPADRFFPADFFSQNSPLFLTFLKYCNILVTMALQLSAPSLIAMLMSDLFLGIANRMAPQVQISFLLWSLKAFIGIALVWAGWWLVLRQLDTQGINWTKQFVKLMHTLGS